MNSFGPSPAWAILRPGDANEDTNAAQPGEIERQQVAQAATSLKSLLQICGVGDFSEWAQEASRWFSRYGGQYEGHVTNNRHKWHAVLEALLYLKAQKNQLPADGIVIDGLHLQIRGRRVELLFTDS